MTVEHPLPTLSDADLAALREAADAGEVIAALARFVPADAKEVAAAVAQSVSVDALSVVAAVERLTGPDAHAKEFNDQMVADDDN